VDRLPKTPVVLDPCFDDPGIVRRLVEANAPYWPVQRYFANSAEYAALSGNDAGDEAMPVAPVFRGDWHYDVPLIEGAEPLLDHEPFAEAARRVFDGADVVRPNIVYANLTWQLPFPQGGGHTDVPAFRGVDRTRYPITFLTIMGQSGLFEAERVNIATAVAWSYAGTDGGFEYWPEGGDAPSVVHEGHIDNTAIVGDNDFMWHRVRPTGKVEDGLTFLSLDGELDRDGDGWLIRDQGATIATFPFEKLRISVSWKATVFADAADARRFDEHTEDIDLDEVLRRISADLTERDVAHRVPEDPVRDPDFVRLLRDAYVREPTTSSA
jgi:hypothetical protein